MEKGARESEKSFRIDDILEQRDSPIELTCKKKGSLENPASVNIVKPNSIKKDTPVSSSSSPSPSSSRTTPHHETPIIFQPRSSSDALLSPSMFGGIHHPHNVFSPGFSSLHPLIRAAAGLSSGTPHIPVARMNLESSPFFQSTTPWEGGTRSSFPSEVYALSKSLDLPMYQASSSMYHPYADYKYPNPSHPFLSRIPYGVDYMNGRNLYHFLQSENKRKGGQIRFSNSQTSQLEKAFVEHKYQSAHERRKLATSLGLTDRQVKTWFQNRRAKWRKVVQRENYNSTSNHHHRSDSVSSDKGKNYYAYNTESLMRALDLPLASKGSPTMA